MTYLSIRDTAGREPITIVECDLDKCAEVYGVSPCTASLGTGNECYNTRKSCQDPANYNNSTTLTHAFSSRQVDGQTYIPCIAATKLSPTEITPGQPFNKRAAITITLEDFAHHDIGIDPYVSTRSYTAMDQGTYFGKLIARNPFYQGRPLRLLTGYVDDPFSVGDLQTENYIIEKITYSKKGKITILAKDILKLADDKRSTCPQASSGKLVSAISSSDTSLTVTSGTEDEYLGANILGDTLFGHNEFTEGTGWSVDGAIASAATGSASDISKSVFIEEAGLYIVTFTVANRTAGDVTPKFKGTTDADGTTRSTNAEFTETITTNVGNNVFAWSKSSTFDGDISIISVKKIQEYIRIGEEMILAPYANRTANVFANLTRGTWNKAAAAHALGDAVQVCEYFNARNVTEIVHELVVNYAGVLPAYIPTADWDTEKDTWLPGHNLTRLLTEPFGVKQLLDEISEQLMVYVWWESVDQEVKLKAIAPPTTAISTLSEDSSIIKDIVVSVDQKDRLSR